MTGHGNRSVTNFQYSTINRARELADRESVPLFPWEDKEERKRKEVVKWVTSFLYFYVYSNRPLGSNMRPRWRVLPPEIIRMILQFLKADKTTLCAYSRVARKFYYVTLSLLGRHLIVNTVSRFKGYVKLVAGGHFNTPPLLALVSTRRK